MEAREALELRKTSTIQDIFFSFICDPPVVPVTRFGLVSIGSSLITFPSKRNPS